MIYRWSFRECRAHDGDFLNFFFLCYSEGGVQNDLFISGNVLPSVPKIYHSCGAILALPLAGQAKHSLTDYKCVESVSFLPVFFVIMLFLLERSI